MPTDIAPREHHALAQHTHACREDVQRELRRYCMAVHNLCGPRIANTSTEAVKQAQMSYDAAVASEICAVAALPPPKSHEEWLNACMDRTALLTRGAVRLGLGIALTGIYGLVGESVAPKQRKEKLRHLAVVTLGSGGFADLTRALRPASMGLRHKREYQLRQSAHAGYMQGVYGPVPEAPSVVEVNAETNVVEQEARGD